MGCDIADMISDLRQAHARATIRSQYVKLFVSAAATRALCRFFATARARKWRQWGF
jgi:hypothetical protein